MNILLINTTYQGGGAEKVTRQLFHGYEAYDINIRLLVGRGEIGNSLYDIIYDKKIPYFFTRVYGRLAPYRRYDPYATATIIKTIKKYNIDIVHLQNIHGNYMGIIDVAKISKHCRVIWTLHDMWAITGHCAHSFDCSKWEQGDCSNCPKPDTYPAIKYNVANNMLKCKEKSFTGNNIVFVSPSNWLRDCFKRSILKDERIQVINNGVDTNLYHPMDVKMLREKYNIPLDKHVLLFAASDLNSQFRSFKHLIEALSLIKDKENYCLIVLGNYNTSIDFGKGFIVFPMGYIQDEETMASLYALSDLYITPSLADNFPCTTIESYACGTPVIAFASGGLVEQIDSKSGYLVPTGDSQKLCQAIEAAFLPTTDMAGMRAYCRDIAVSKYSERVMLDNYLTLYNKVYKGEL